MTLFSIPSGIDWRRTIIRPRTYGLETELHFDYEGEPASYQLKGQSFSVAFDSLPDTEFLRRATTIQSLDIFEENAENLGEVDAIRYRVQIVGGEPLHSAMAYGSYVRWGPVEPDESDAVLDSGD